MSFTEFKVKVLNVYTRDLKVDITLQGIHKSATVHHGNSQTNGVTREVTTDFGEIPAVGIGSPYNICLSVLHHNAGFCNDNEIDSIPVQEVTLDTDDIED